ncbi:MAG: FAD-linked oxidase C-terminal domain-containing protein [Candidatus Nezhaarchaeota archaeon]|nr:FAD-linked oxidase C-terminal domain-containing protein [Candidatus Nezhaarchaeota archaeon]
MPSVRASAGPSPAGGALQLAQGTIGIVTWASIRCRAMPEVRKALLIPSDDLARLIELTYKLTWRRLGDALFILNNCNLACIVGRSSREALELLESLPQWLLFISIEPSGYYAEKKAEVYEDELSKWCRTFGVEPKPVISTVSADDVMTLTSEQSEEQYWKLKLKGGVQELFFITTMDKVQEFVQIMRNVAGTHGYSTKDMGVYVQPIMQGSSCHCEFDLYYDPQDPTSVETIRKVFYDGARALVRAGAFFARPYGPLRDITYPYIAAPAIILQRKLKAIFDPNNIMNPGKLYYG